MGFRDFRAFNKALLARQGWRLLKHPNSFCARFLKGLYYPNTDFLNDKKGGRALCAWASLIEGQTVLNRGVHWQVCNGKSIKFWED